MGRKLPVVTVCEFLSATACYAGSTVCYRPEADVVLPVSHLKQGMQMHTDTPMFIATQSILWLRSDGSEVMIEAKIGAPNLVDDQTWACPACLEGVDGRYPDIVGEGSFQALSLAIRLIGNRLRHLLEDSAQLVYPVDRSAWDWSAHAAVFGAAKSN